MADDSFETGRHPEPGQSDRRRASRLASIGAVALLLLLGAGSVRVMLIRNAAAEALHKSLLNQQRVFVAYTYPSPTGSDGASQVQLPGTLQGAREAAVYARASGYVRRWTRDIGARVQRGEVITEIETPELAQQILQARANARQAALNLDLARQTLARWEGLRTEDLVTQQELDERRSTAEQLSATLAAASAEVARLESLSAFQRVEAPFSGVITRRNVEIGSLVNAGNGGQAQALFLLASTDRLRLEIFVPQAYAAQVRTGMPVEVSQSELPGARFPGRVARTAGAIDSATRTLQVEVDLPNPGNRLLPGSYVQATLPLRRGSSLAVPANTLLFRAEGPRLGLVDDQGRVRLAPITLGRDLGKTIEILAGVASSDRVILNPPDALADGDRVEARAVAASAAGGAVR